MGDKDVKGKLYDIKEEILRRKGGDALKQNNRNLTIKSTGNSGIQINNQVIGDVNIGNIKIDTTNTTPRKKKDKAGNIKIDVKMQYPEGTIGADPILRQTIQNFFNRIGEEREKRFSKQAYPVMYANFKKAFDIEGKYTDYLLWPKQCATDIIRYLNDKYNNTIQGRKENAGKRSDYMHTRPYLYELEKELLPHLGVEWKSEQHKKMLIEHFGTSSYKEISHGKHWLWVNFLQSEVEKI